MHSGLPKAKNYENNSKSNGEKRNRLPSYELIRNLWKWNQFFMKKTNGKIIVDKTTLLNFSNQKTNLASNSSEIKRLSCHVVWGWHFTAGQFRWWLRSLLWSVTSWVIGSGWDGAIFSQLWGLPPRVISVGPFPKFGWSFRLESCRLNRLLSLLREAAVCLAKVFALVRGLEG